MWTPGAHSMTAFNRGLFFNNRLINVCSSIVLSLNRGLFFNNRLKEVCSSIVLSLNRGLFFNNCLSGACFSITHFTEIRSYGCENSFLVKLFFVLYVCDFMSFHAAYLCMIQCRLYNPNVDLITAPWHPFKVTPWVMPLLTDLSNWRQKLDDIERDIYMNSNGTDVVFIADFPGEKIT